MIDALLWKSLLAVLLSSQPTIVIDVYIGTLVREFVTHHVDVAAASNATNASAGEGAGGETNAEEAAARRNFAVNDALINKHNSSLPYTLGHNAYSDQDLASLASRRNGFVASAKLGVARRHTPRSHSLLPSQRGWTAGWRC